MGPEAQKLFDEIAGLIEKAAGDEDVSHEDYLMLLDETIASCEAILDELEADEEGGADTGEGAPGEAGALPDEPQGDES